LKKLVRIKLIENCPNKLIFVRLIKDCSGLGLKESKDICDRLHAGEVQTFEAREDDAVNYAKKFRQDIVSCGGKFQVSGGVEFQRNYKMLELGIGDDSDYVDFISESIFQNNLENSEEFLKFVLSKFNREELIEIFDKSKESYKYILD
jgi:hypothetical protein